MIDDETTPDAPEPEDTPAEEPVAETGSAPQPPEEQPQDAPAEEPAAEEVPAEVAEEPVVEEPVVEEPAAEEPVVEEPAAEEPAAEEPAAEEAPAEVAEVTEAAADAPESGEEPAPPAPQAETPGDAEEIDETPRVKPAIPGADLEVDIVPEGYDPLTGEQRPSYSEDGDEDTPGEGGEADEPVDQPLTEVTINLAADARYRATGKRKTAIARVILKPGTGSYTINGKELNAFFPRPTLQRNIRQPLETVGYEEKMDVIAHMRGGGVSSQAGALRHGISRALLEADPNLRGELKRRGFLTRDPRVKERKKAGLKKARKRPQFSKR
jgi:small subunit ribosomal protein S9